MTEVDSNVGLGFECCNVVCNGRIVCRVVCDTTVDL